ncbi:MAG: GFA family protein [Pikeienuella sp.]
MEHQGGCLCGAVRWRATAEPVCASYCHCEMCRRVSGAPFMAFVEFPDGAVEWSGEEPQVYRGSPTTSRRFCGTCGGSLSFDADEAWFLALGSFDEPERVKVQQHCYAATRLPQLDGMDDLPVYPGPFGGKGGVG